MVIAYFTGKVFCKYQTFKKIPLIFAIAVKFIQMKHKRKENTVGAVFFKGFVFNFNYKSIRCLC